MDNVDGLTPRARAGGWIYHRRALLARLAWAVAFMAAGGYALSEVTTLYGAGAETVFTAFAYAIIGLGLAMCGAVLLANPIAELVVRFFDPRTVSAEQAGTVPLRYLQADLSEKEGHFEEAFNRFLRAAETDEAHALPYERAMSIAAVRLLDAERLHRAYEAGVARLVDEGERERLRAMHAALLDGLEPREP